MRTLLIALPALLVASPVFAQAQGPTPAPPAAKPAEAAAPAAPAPAAPAPAAPAPEKVELQEQQPAAPNQAAGTANVATATPAPAGAVVAMQGATPPAKNEPASTSASPSQRGSDVAASDNSWKLEYHGYLRAPMRVGLGAGAMHYPVLPDDQYLNWQFTSHNKKDWAEMFFTYGNSWAKGTLALQGFNFTDAAWADQVAQFGISQGYVELTPDLGFENVRLSAKGGSFWARYGMAGKWDAGEYDTYLFGRTHAMGGLVHLDYDIDDATTLWFEAGVGTKRPDPSQFNNARFTMLYHGHAGLKLGSDVEFSTHLMWLSATEEDRIIRQVNTVPTGMTAGLQDPYNPPNYPSSLMGLPDGRMFITGLDARLEIGALGYLYAGYSHINAKNALSVAPAVEVLHAFGGGQYQLGVTDNYFGPGCRAVSTDPTNTMPGGVYGTPANSCSMGTGSVNSVLAQYEFSLANFQQISSGGQKFWGEGTDFKAVLYGMVNFVNSDVKTTLMNGETVYDGVMKLKYGADLQYAAIPWMTFALRADRVQPNNHIPEQSFSILSPRVVFKSKWVTREQISIQYSRYIYNQRECAPGMSPALAVANPSGGVPDGHLFTEQQYYCTQPPAAPTSSEGFGSNWENQDAGLRGAPTTRPDVNVVSVTASMWW